MPLPSLDAGVNPIVFGGVLTLLVPLGFAVLVGIWLWLQRGRAE